MTGKKKKKPKSNLVDRVNRRAAIFSNSWQSSDQKALSSAEASSGCTDNQWRDRTASEIKPRQGRKPHQSSLCTQCHFPKKKKKVPKNEKENYSGSPKKCEIRATNRKRDRERVIKTLSLALLTQTNRLIL